MVKGTGRQGERTLRQRNIPRRQEGQQNIQAGSSRRVASAFLHIEAALGRIESNMSRVEIKVDRIEHMLSMLLRHFNIPLPPRRHLPADDESVEATSIDELAHHSDQSSDS